MMHILHFIAILLNGYKKQNILHAIIDIVTAILFVCFEFSLYCVRYIQQNNPADALIQKFSC